MTPDTRLITWVIAAMMIFAAMSPNAAFAEDKDELKARFKQRDAELSRLKAQGRLGETWQGYVDAVKNDPPLDAASRRLMDEENNDRKQLYSIIASEQKTRAENVGVQSGLRNFASAKPAEFLKVKTGPWVRRSDVNPAKREGKIGETWEGYIEVVEARDRDDARLAAIVDVENSARKYTYKIDGHKKKTSADDEAQRAGRENLNAARRGEFIKNKDGRWERKS